MNARRRTMESDLLGRRPRQDVADHPARPVGHRLPRQRARAAGRRRLLAGARDDDADPGGLGRQSADGCQAQGLLRIPRRADGAVGRPGRRSPSPTAARSAPRSTATACARRASSSPTTTIVIMASEVGRAADPRREDRAQVAPAARQDAADRPRAGPHRRGRGDQAHARRGRALRGVADGRRSTSWRSCSKLPETPRRRRRTIPTTLLDRQQAFGYTQEDLQFFLEPMARAGDDPVGSMGTDTPIAVLSQQAQAALQLLQAELRPGHQPADRSDPRGAGDVAWCR